MKMGGQFYKLIKFQISDIKVYKNAQVCMKKLYVHCRDFDLVLKPETRFFHENFTLTMDGKKVSAHHVKYNLYSGFDRSELLNLY